jgi:toxin ParE1/3/4
VPASGRSDASRPREPAGLILEYHPAASDELVEAARFYEGREAGLGHRFLDAVDASLANLKRNPRVAPSDERGRRKYLVRGFPYVIICKIRNTSIHVLAIAHTSRKPGYWRSRDSASR